MSFLSLYRSRERLTEIVFKLLNKKEKHPKFWCFILCFTGRSHSLKGSRLLLSLELLYLSFQFSKSCCVPGWKEANFFLALPQGGVRKLVLSGSKAESLGLVSFIVHIGVWFFQ